jgi:hypothetical protein
MKEVFCPVQRKCLTRTRRVRILAPEETRTMDKLKLTSRVSTYSEGEQSDGLRLLDYVDYSSGDYCFDYRAVWTDKQGRLWTARDSGCSCPSPFEDTDELSRVWSSAELREEYLDNSGCLSQQDFDAFIKRVEEALAALRTGGDPLTRLEQIKKEVGL